MPNFTIVRVDPHAERWTGLRTGYRVLGNLHINGLYNHTVDCIPLDPRLSYVDQDTGWIYSVRDGILHQTETSTLAYRLGYEMLDRLASRDGGVLVQLEIPTDTQVRQITKRIVEEAVEMKLGDIIAWLKEGKALFLTRTALMRLLLASLNDTTGSAVGHQVCDLLPNLRPAGL